MFLRFAAVIVSVTLVFAQADTPALRAEDVRPQGAAEPHPLAPGLGVWIFGVHLAASPGCAAANLTDPATYRTELCGTRVLIGGIEAKLLFVARHQMANLRGRVALDRGRRVPNSSNSTGKRGAHSR